MKKRWTREDAFRERAAELVLSTTGSILDDSMKVDRFIVFSEDGTFLFRMHMLAVQENLKSGDVVYDLGKLPLVPATHEEIFS